MNEGMMNVCVYVKVGLQTGRTL